ncbi:MAG: choice-of-anchor D domain-containing protein [Verrucomicrobia bacterium]|nr:choice-of-anchor D domain-containing protein [Verrucomicrobiota bacterium]
MKRTPLLPIKLPLPLGFPVVANPSSESLSIMKPCCSRRVLSGFIAAILAMPFAQAATGTWTGGATGTWNTSSTNWTGLAGTPWDMANGPGNTALFTTVGDAATLSGTVVPGTLQFNQAATVSGPGTLGFGTTTSTMAANVASGRTATISAGFAGAVAAVDVGNKIAKTGSGTLVLSGATNLVTGDIDTGLDAGYTVEGGGTLQITGQFKAASLSQATPTGQANFRNQVGAASADNSLIVNGSGAVMAGGIDIGGATFGSNSVTISSPGTQALPSYRLIGINRTVTLGVASSNNSLTVNNGAFFLYSFGGGGQTLQMGVSAGANNNSILVDGAGSTFDKAAYYDPGLGGYWLYATRNNSVPTVATANATGDISNPGANVANHTQGAVWNGLTGNVTTVGSAGAASASYSGTCDQSGNVWEWTDYLNAGSPTYPRQLRGGGWDDGETGMRASFAWGALPTVEVYDAGFRVAAAAVPLMAVEQPAGTGLTSGSSTVDFGSSQTGAAVPLTFTIKNTGFADLTGIAVTCDGTNRADFTITTAPATSVVAGDSTSFVVTFTPAAPGSRVATLLIASNDATHNPFNLALTGTGAAPPSSAKDILTFDFGTLGAATIAGTGISLTVPSGTNVTALAPSYTVSAGAAGSPASGTARNFATPQTYTVTAPDGSTKVYSVTVTVAPLIEMNGLALWLDASQLTGLSDGQQVETWTDMSGRNNHAVRRAVSSMC